MSDIIRLLPEKIANQIAAGEVIQRPSSVVKELIENAVDAGSTKIELHIKDAGRTAIQIIDNGVGMSDKDAVLSFQRHATSKVKNADDLFNLSTKGFRGEALASIASIAHVTLDTRQEDQELGIRVEVAGNEVSHQEPITKNKGTSVLVKNLFFNVPARRNFLKADPIELKHILEEFNRIALSHPEIAFKVSHNGNTIHDLNPGILRKRIIDLFGKNFNDKLVPISEETDIVKIAGFVVKPEFSKKTRGEQYFFVNQRFFKSAHFHHAVANAFDNLIQPKAFPSYFIFLDVPKDSIDINIHPTKTEIKFEDDRGIYSILRSTIKLALGKYNIAPTIDFELESQFDVPPLRSGQEIRPPKIDVDPNFNPFSSIERNQETKHRSYEHTLKPNRTDWENYYEILEENESQQSIFTNEENPASDFMLVKGRFLLTSIKSGILCIDIKRAKQRILYDQLMSKFIKEPIASQQLLFPIEQNLLATEKLEWENNKRSLKRIGFDWEWDGNRIIFASIPAHLKAENILSHVDDINQKISNKNIDKGELAHELIVSLSQHNYLNINTLRISEKDELINSLFACEEHQYDPNGNLIMHTIGFDEILKKF